jgi:hypothetical protein
MNEHLAALRALQRVGVHVVARARIEHAGRFSMRITPGGFGTPAFGDDCRCVRVSGTTLIVESDRPGAASIRTVEINGSTLSELAAHAVVDLTSPLDVGHDTPPLGDVDEIIRLEPIAASGVADAYASIAAVLDRTTARLPAASEPTLPRLWPEHFDVAVEAQATPDRRVNLGGSPGDEFCSEPYFYVGPWTGDRPGDAAFWNAPFGAVRTVRELGPDVEWEAAAFLVSGFELLSRR